MHWGKFEQLVRSNPELHAVYSTIGTRRLRPATNVHGVFPADSLLGRVSSVLPDDCWRASLPVIAAVLASAQVLRWDNQQGQRVTVAQLVVATAPNPTTPTAQRWPARCLVLDAATAHNHQMLYARATPPNMPCAWTLRLRFRIRTKRNGYQSSLVDLPPESRHLMRGFVEAKLGRLQHERASPEQIQHLSDILGDNRYFAGKMSLGALCLWLGYGEEARLQLPAGIRQIPTHYYCDHVFPVGNPFSAGVASGLCLCPRHIAWGTARSNSWDRVCHNYAADEVPVRRLLLEQHRKRQQIGGALDGDPPEQNDVRHKRHRLP